VNVSTRVVFNTGVLYTKLLFGVVIGLFTTRLILNALGETDFGIFALVAGVVGMLGILSSSMTTASMRFMAHSLGTGDLETIKKTFNTTLFLHIVIGLILVIIMEAGGLLMFEYLLNIPEERILDAKLVFHFMVITTFVTIISVPYDAIINAHENILALSLVDVLGYLLRLGIAVYLTYSAANLLVLYGFLMLVAQIILRMIKQWYSKFKYRECKINFRAYTDRELSKIILSFSGWNMFGSVAAMSVTQVRGILLNVFFGVTLNAADGISRRASEPVNMISNSMTRALNPQLVISEGRGDRQRMLRLTEIATKFSVFLFALFAIPVIVEAHYLLNLWLTMVPEYAVIFCQLILIGLLLDKFTFEITSALRAVGKIKEFQIAETIIILFNIPLAYITFKMGYPPPTIFFIGISLSAFAIITRLYFARNIAGMDIKSFLKNGIISILLPLIFTISVVLAIQYYLTESFLRFMITIITSMSVITTTFWLFGLRDDETKKLKRIISSMTKKAGITKKTN
jgi:O-antigen/teichoic acid export membrane protein